MKEEKELKGYLKNKSHLGAHIMKRYVAPNGLIPLEELYIQYGKKYDLKKDASFITWLQDVKVRDKDRWVIIDEDIPAPVVDNSIAIAEEKEDLLFANKRPTDFQVMDLVELSVRKARELIPKIGDPKLLKYTLKEASQRANKESLCGILKKRINDLAAQGIS